MPPKISVVVPFHDVEAHLAECLESLARQTLRDLEVVMVDDGSADGGSVIAKEFADRDDRFVLVQRGHEGLGPARNAGVARAGGQYLAFAGAADTLPPYAYELLVRTLEATGSDIAGGNVLRLDDDRAWQSPLHAGAYAATVKRTHITRHPALLQDRTVWNKVYRRSFWDAHRFEFPAMSHEDPPVSLEAHVLASAVDVLDTAVYFWRHRQEPPSPNPQANAADRIASLEMVRGILGDHAPALLPVYDKHALDLDVRALILALPTASGEHRDRLLEAGADIVAAAAPSAFQGLEAIKRLELHLLRERMLPELLDVLRFEENGLHDVPLVSRGRRRQRWYARYPFYGDRARAVPDEVYDVTDELRLHAEVDRVTWDSGSLVVQGHAHFDRLAVTSAKDSRIRIWMHDAKTGKEIRLPVERIPCPEATVQSGQSLVSYDWSGFSIRIEPELLQDGDDWPTVTWELFAEVTASGCKAVQRLTSAEPAVNWAAPRQVDEHVAVQPAADQGFVVHVKRAKAVVTGYRRVGDLLEITGWTRLALGPGAAIVATRRHGGPEVRGEVTVRPAAGMRMDRGTGFDFMAALPLGALHSDPEAAERGPATHLRDAIDWDIRLVGADGPLRLTVARTLPGARFATRGREFALTRTAYGNLRGVERSFRPVVTSVRWTADDRLTLTGDLSDPAHRPTHLILRRRPSGDEHRLPLTWDGPTFTATFAPGAMPLFGTAGPLTTGLWDLLAPTPGTAKRADGTPTASSTTASPPPKAAQTTARPARPTKPTPATVKFKPNRRHAPTQNAAPPTCAEPGEIPVVVERAVISDLPEWRAAGTHEFEARVHQTDALQLRSRTVMAEDERGGHAQRLLWERDYPVYLRSPLTELVVFDSYGASQYSCNPRAIYEEITRSHPGLECVWISTDGQFNVEGDAKVLIAGTREHYRALARARYIVTNYGLAPGFAKRPEQTYMQTWHGTPLKRLGYDLSDLHSQRAENLRWIDYEVPRWDVVLSPNTFTSDTMRRAFRYEGEILETGYPRNDVLSSPEFDRLGARVRERLGIPAGKKVVLYAPTWRDDHHLAPGRRAFSMELDVEALRRALGDDHVLLVRPHFLITEGDRPRSDGFTIDVSRYPDIADLYLASDVLVTDYSSAMFDFACTGRPMLFYTYDLARYRDHMRGFSLDFETEAPGPLLTTSTEVAEALRAIDEIQDAYVDAYDTFFDKYCPHDDGKAAARAAERLLA
ncbi:CDP-glycerol glycerophosphotransferase family protein [Actinomadura sp. NEAU-AAG7]|uniref:CDP-glycerol glycerophosphotransferase family protein n=1 Tax=Actinomadura sp. NEAU-AAG7 TaxID=2839640 RepID=UPI001BE43530|nr:CDP-glycerol glycerophosphotransferase family protein [Actinomadura sp. NEAU-AAG7]MBT2210493.1 CDP-glycerol glycerophosphotransferase family protein [Actinomadura sp. NEAU-AAG7]